VDQFSLDVILNNTCKSVALTNSIAPDSCPVISQSPIYIHERRAVKGSARGDGKEEKEESNPPSHHLLRSRFSRDPNIHDWRRVSQCNRTISTILSQKFSYYKLQPAY